jgi:hypothetical protein
MTKEYDAALGAKRSLKAHIDFMETLVKHLNGPDKALRGRAVVASWCIHRYFNEKLMSEIKEMIEKSTPLTVGQ